MTNEKWTDEDPPLPTHFIWQKFLIIDFEGDFQKKSQEAEWDQNSDPFVENEATFDWQIQWYEEQYFKRHHVCEHASFCWQSLDSYILLELCWKIIFNVKDTLKEFLMNTDHECNWSSNCDEVNHLWSQKTC